MYYAQPEAGLATQRPPSALPAGGIVREPGGCLFWQPLPGDLYRVDGENDAGQPVCTITNSWHQARSLSVRNATIWLVRGNRKIKLKEKPHGSQPEQ